MQNIFGADALTYLARILAFATAIPFHEAAHAFVSYKLGDPTAKNQGRLTLNPLKHLDPWGFAAMLIVGIGWAKPVPINPNYYKNRKVGMALSAAAGPVSNLLLAFVMYILGKVVYYSGFVSMANNNLAAYPEWIWNVQSILMTLAVINIWLAVFNLLPIPPFDGSRVLGLILPEKIYFGIQHVERYIMAVVLIIMVLLPRLTGWDPIGTLLSFAHTHVIDFFNWCTGFIDRIFMSFI